MGTSWSGKMAICFSGVGFKEIMAGIEKGADDI